MQQKILATLLATSLLSQTARSETACQTPAEFTEAGCQCYDKLQLEKIASAITELKTCRIAVEEQQKLIQERLVHAPAEAPEETWWQEPRVVIGGLVVTVALSSLITVWAVGKSKDK
jgi:hypothetical protein